MSWRPSTGSKVTRERCQMSAEQQRASLPPVHGRSHHRGFRDENLVQSPPAAKGRARPKPRSERCRSSRPWDRDTASLAESSVFWVHSFVSSPSAAAQEIHLGPASREPPSLPANPPASPCSWIPALGVGPPGSGGRALPQSLCRPPPTPQYFHSVALECSYLPNFSLFLWALSPVSPEAY